MLYLDARADAPAVISPEDGELLTRERVAEDVAELASRLSGFGVRRGDRVAYLFANGPECVQLLLAITSLGAAAAPLNPAYRRQELAFYLEDLAPRALIVPGGVSVDVTSVPVCEMERGARGSTLRAGGREISRGPVDDAPSSDDIALLLHTSGTTNRPKQVPLLHRNLLASARAIVDHYELTDRDLAYCGVPLFHVHGLVGCVIAPLLAGSSVVLPRRFATGTFWRHLLDYPVTWFSAVPTIHQKVLEGAPAAPLGESSRLRFVRSASAALAPALQEKLEALLVCPVLEAYGMTEASHQISSNPLPPAPRLPGSVGLPTGTEILIVDDGSRPLPLGGEGEVAVRGPGITPGYLNNPLANEEAFFDGWFRTGDLGRFEENGYLRLTGRLKEMIIRGGENISPYEIEAVLLSHPAVAEAACFGVPNDKYGEEVAAVVVLRDEVELRDLSALCRDRLAAFKAPTLIERVDSIPKTPTGKVQRARMATELAKVRS